jgi:short-subunit dehydrogenase
LSSKVKVNPFYNKNVFFYNFDITNIEEVKYNSKLIKTQVGNVNILINNAGIMNQAKLFMDLSENEILNIFNVNILSQFWMIREFLPRMLEENKGHIVNVSSSLGMV